jgi:hypothetical protein
MLFLNNIYFQIGLIIILLLIIIWLSMENFDSVSVSTSHLPPHIEQLPHQQMEPLDVPNESYISPTVPNAYKPPNYGKMGGPGGPQGPSMIPGNIYRMKTGREAFEQEQFVSIYDSNFGGLLGTTMGLTD